MLKKTKQTLSQPLKLWHKKSSYRHLVLNELTNSKQNFVWSYGGKNIPFPKQIKSSIFSCQKWNWQLPAWVFSGVSMEICCDVSSLEQTAASTKSTRSCSAAESLSVAQTLTVLHIVARSLVKWLKQVPLKLTAVIDKKSNDKLISNSKEKLFSCTSAFTQPLVGAPQH